MSGYPLNFPLCLHVLTNIHTCKTGNQIQNGVISAGKAGFIDKVVLKFFMSSLKLGLSYQSITNSKNRNSNQIEE